MPYQTCFYYNLDNSVGRNCANTHADVKVIESLLQIIGDTDSMERWKGFAKVLGIADFQQVKRPPRPTGTYNTDLQLWIDLVTRIHGCHSDGKVDPLPDTDGSVQTWRGGKPTSLYKLNQIAMFSNFPQFLRVGDQLGLLMNQGLKGFNVGRK